MPLPGPGSPPPAEVAIDGDLARHLIDEQHPELASLAIRRATEGWDNVTFRLGDTMAVRLPRRAIAANLVVNEQRWLPQLGPHLSLPVPVPMYIGLPSTLFRWHWSIVPWIAGSSALDTPLLAEEAVRLGQFLGDLHRIEVPEDPPQNPFRGGPLRLRRAATEGRLGRLRAALPGSIDVHALAAFLAAGFDVPIDTPAVWLHGDLHAKNVVSKEGRIAAVIDWGDICTGDPATDLASVWNLFELDAHDPFWESYGEVSPSTRRRAATWAAAFGLMLWDGHHRTDATFAELGLRTLRRVTATGL